MTEDTLSAARAVALEELLRVVALAAHEAESVHDALELSLKEICEYSGWPIGHALLKEQNQGDTWRSSKIWHTADETSSLEFKYLTEGMRFRPEMGVFAQVAAERGPVWIEDVTEYEEFQRSEIAHKNGISSSLVIPISVDDEVEALLEFFSVERMDPEPGLLEVLGQIGQQLGVVLRQKRAEEALRASQERFRALVINARDLIVLFAAQGEMQYLSPSVERVLGYPPGRLQETSVFDLIHPDDRAQATRIIERLLQRPAETGEFEVRVRRQDGSWRWLETTVANHLSHPHVAALVANARDVTGRRLAEEQLEQTARELATSNEDLERFAYVASHDLQEPLRMVSSYVHLLERRYADELDEDGKEFIGYAVAGAARMSRLINDLLDYSRLGTRGQELRPTDLEVALEQALDNLASTLAESEAEITWGSLPRVQGDRGQLMQVLQNLVSNAVKFQAADARPRMHISAVRNADMWRISVRDNGIGVESDFMDRLFVIFQRLHTRAEYGGTGIGLAMCKKIVERHGGEIGVDSTPGEGSTFWFTLPAAEERNGETQGIRREGE